MLCIYQVAIYDKLQLVPETLSLSVQLMDRYLALHIVQSVGQLKLISIACLMVHSTPQ